MTNQLPDKRYIGDGLYASHDGCQFWLEASNGEWVSDRVALEPNTMAGLDDYREYVAQHYKSVLEGGTN